MYNPQQNYPNPTYGAGYTGQFMPNNPTPYTHNANDFRRTNVEWIRVPGIQQVRDHNVMPNQQLWFMDNNMPLIYIKSADNFGTAQIEIYRVEKIQENEIYNESNAQSQISRQEFDDLKNRVQAYEQLLSELRQPVPEYANGGNSHESNGKNGNK